jgi:hypothetical protein
MSLDQAASDEGMSHRETDGHPLGGFADIFRPVQCRKTFAIISDPFSAIMTVAG